MEEREENVPSLTQEESKELKNKIKKITKNLNFEIEDKKKKINNLEDPLTLIDMFLFSKNLLESVYFRFREEFENIDLKYKIENYLLVFQELNSLRKHYYAYLGREYEKDYYKRILLDKIEPHQDNMVNFVYFIIGESKIFMADDNEDYEDTEDLLLSGLNFKEKENVNIENDAFRED